MNASRRFRLAAALRLCVTALVLVTLAAPALANFAGTDVVIPSLGHGPGSAGAQWYACVRVHNPNASSGSVTFLLLLCDQANPSAEAIGECLWSAHHRARCKVT